QFIAASVNDDEELRREVESLLASDDASATLLDRLPLADAPVTIAASSHALPAFMDDDPSTLQPGHRIGPYEISGLLGAGAMGQVYRARDAKLNRDVALKVLPALLALDSDRLKRFKREAQVLAALNHPNIAAIYGFEDSTTQQALVLELVEGPTLADVIAPRPLGIRDALTVARPITDALAAAYTNVIIHRDLKPANIKTAASGSVKVLDFGLAKVWDDAPGALLSGTPTMTLSEFGERAILGTPGYMSPEQARGASLDKRTDI